MMTTDLSNPPVENIGLISDKIKSETSKFHSMAEQKNYSGELMSGTIKTEDYGKILKRLHCFFSQAHTVAAAFADDIIFPLHVLSDKVNLLAEDLAELGFNEPHGYTIFEKLDYYNCLGFCYVPLGSMLGGNHIYTSLIKTEASRGYCLPTRFYSSCKEVSIAHWKNFMAQLNGLNGQHDEAIITGSKTSYLYFLYLCDVI